MALLGGNLGDPLGAAESDGRGFPGDDQRISTSLVLPSRTTVSLSLTLAPGSFATAIWKTSPVGSVTVISSVQPVSRFTWAIFPGGAAPNAGSLRLPAGRNRNVELVLGLAFVAAKGESWAIAATSPTVGLHEDTASIVSALVSRARVVTGMNITSAAVRDADGQFPMTVYRGIRSDAYRTLKIKWGAGLGGLVLKSGEPVRLPDYHRSSLITPDYMNAVDVEGIHGIACVPVLGPDGVSALLYAAVRTEGTPGDIAVIRLEGLAAEAGTALHHLAIRASQAELAALRQRQVIAGRLHDSIAQTLFSVGVLAHRSRGETDPAVLADSLAEIEIVAGAARTELRATLADLCRVPDGRGLDLALVAEGRTFTAASGVPVWWSHRGTPRGLAPELTELVVDGLREGLRNAVKHADAEQVMATLRWGSTEVVLVLQMHWGEQADRMAARVEVDAANGMPWRPGSGLGMIADRAAALGGLLELTIDPERDGLVVQRLTLPAPGYDP
jgi:signal transduction histidine kinase